MSYDPENDLITVTYNPPMAPRDAVLLTSENWDAMYDLVQPNGPVLLRPDFSEAQPGDYAVRVPDSRQMDQVMWVVMPADWITEI